mmetsp:Transcript_27152/g.33757  ORF Transcript_27152/g.33757 Transcript_27152/m.33757 type:complete len:109 (+) Transcript_27152:117-443(+)
MVESKPESKQSNFAEGVHLVMDAVERASSLIIINGLFYYVPCLAMLRLLAKPHDVVNMGYLTYDVCKLSYLIGRGVLRRLVQVSNCIMALKDKEHHSEQMKNKMPIAE